MLIGSLVELHVGLHSCLCFSHLEKLLLKAGSTPPRYLLDSQLSVKLPKLFLITISPAPRYLVDRSRLGLYPRQLLDTWWIDRAFVLDSDVLFLDTSAINEHFLDTSSTDPSIPLDTCICRDLLAALYKASVRSKNHFSSISLSMLLCFSPKTLSYHSKLVPQGFFKLFQVSLYLVSF